MLRTFIAALIIALPRHATPGEPVTVPAWILGTLDPSDWRRVDP
jgi:hypothetical protein